MFEIYHRETLGRNCIPFSGDLRGFYIYLSSKSLIAWNGGWLRKMKADTCGVNVSTSNELFSQNKQNDPEKFHVVTSTNKHFGLQVNIKMSHDKRISCLFYL